MEYFDDGYDEEFWAEIELLQREQDEEMRAVEEEILAQVHFGD